MSALNSQAITVATKLHGGARLSHRERNGRSAKTPVLYSPTTSGGRSEIAWPGLDDLALSTAELESRSMAIGGSDANVILSGSAERIIRLWREKRGQADAEDLTDKLPVMLGCWTEAFNR